MCDLVSAYKSGGESQLLRSARPVGVAPSMSKYTSDREGGRVQSREMSGMAPSTLASMLYRNPESDSSGTRARGAGASPMSHSFGMYEPAMS